ncbi:MAG: hypothetical protein NC206_07530 [Bacteroides sp.]|nr:hypothetical protein [Roseburia sp.]MCM1346922.1 hypothetical protein [Bacteroides sp.]MCM1421453.1 hypothetical protein [Bacteroides sp.]
MNGLLAFFRTWPVAVAIWYKTRILQDKYALRWLDDIKPFGKSFFALMAERPFYVNLACHRLGRFGSALILLCGYKSGGGILYSI